jgi:hypothetical protein
VGTVYEVFVVEDAFGEPAKEAGHAVLQHLAARAQEGGAFFEHPSER